MPPAYHQFGMLMRRFVVVAAVLVVSGLMPLAAATGFCSAKPCCRAHANTTRVATHPSCCNPANCDATSNHVDATGSTSIALGPHLSASRVIARDIALVIAPFEVSERIDTGPPSTRQRLATLSILLI